MASKNLSLTTTLPYVNAEPHIGFALEIVHADALARYRRQMGDRVFFSTGTDEHGQKIFEAATKAGEDVQTYTDRFAAEFRRLKDALGLSNDTFIRTTDEHHKRAAQEMWRRCSEAGDIYKKSYAGLYCVGCEAFKTTRDVNEEGRCLLHPNAELTELHEENYFFRFSKYADRLREYLSRPGVIVPEWRREEAIAFVESGLEDFSISRERERLSWGVPVPGDDTQVMYVWFDALTNYISTLGWPEDQEGTFKQFWEEGEVVQVAGKDQVRFQSLMWQAMLMSAGIKNTDKVIYHGFITSGGQKMSKSIGNVVHPLTLVEEYGTEPVRYFLLRHMHPFEDSDFTLERFKDAYNGNLANGLGNLAARIMKLAEDHLERPVDLVSDSFPEEYIRALETYQYNRAMDYIFERASALDARITEEKPFLIVKEDKEKGSAMIAELARELWLIGRLLYPFMPQTSVQIKAAVKANKKPDTLFPRKE